MSITRRGRKTGPKPQYQLDDLIDCALRLGLDRFTIAEVANELGMVPSAMYRYVASRDELVMKALEATAAELVPPTKLETWQEVLREWGEATWRICEKYPGLALTILRTPGGHVHAQNFIAESLDALLATGFPGNRSQALFVLDFVGDVVLNTRIAVENLRAHDESGRSGIERAQQVFAEAAQSANREFVLPPEECWAERGFLDQKIDFIIAGCESFRKN